MYEITYKIIKQPRSLWKKIRTWMDLQKHGLHETPVYNLYLTSPWDSITAPRSLKKNLLNKLNLVSPSLQNILRHYPLTNQPAIEQPTNQNQSVIDPPTNQIKLLPPNFHSCIWISMFSLLKLDEYLLS